MSLPALHMVRPLFLSLLILALAHAPSRAWAEDAAECWRHPIDAELDASMEKGLSTADQLAAIAKAEAQWDALLNSHYQDLRKRLPAEAFEALKVSQRRWMEFRDREHAAIEKIFAQTEGSMYLPMQADSRMQLVKARALELASHVEIWNLRSQ